MNLFGDLASKLTGGAAGGGNQTLITSILELLNNREGGLSGLAAAFQQKGLGDIVSSWVGTGQNLPVSSEQVEQVLGSDQIQALAEKAGIPAEEAGSKLAEFLPGIVDKLTPGGAMPQGGDLMSTGMGFLKDLMSGGKRES